MSKKWIQFVIAIIFLLWMQCSFKEPVSPIWDIIANIPLSTEKFIIGKEIVNDSTIVVKGADSTVFISVEGDIDTVKLEREDLKANQSDSTFQIKIDTLVLDSLELLNTGLITLREIFPELSLFVGQTVVVPETTLVLLPEVLTATDFERIHLLSGEVEIAMENHLPFPLGPNSQTPEGLSFQFYDDSVNTLLANVTIPSIIPPGTAASGSDQIQGSGFWVYNRFRLEYIFPIAQSTPVFVTDSLLDSTGYSIVVHLKNFRADRAVARIEKQTFSDTIKIKVKDKHRLREGVVEQGRIDLVFTNGLPIPGVLQFNFPNLQTSQQQSYSDNVFLPARSTVPYSITLDGMRFVPHDPAIEFIDSLMVYVKVFTRRAFEQVSIKSSDSVQVDISASDIYFESFSGLLARDTIEIKPFSESNLIDYHNLSTGIQFNNAELLITLFNELFVESLLVDLKITGFKLASDGGISDSATITLMGEQINPGRPGQPGETEIFLSGQSVVQFLNLLPDSFVVKGNTVLSGEAEVVQNASVSGTYLFSTPLQFSIQNANPIQSDVDTLSEEDLGEDIRDAAENDLQNGALNLNLTNHTPLGGTARIIISADSTRQDLYDTTYFNPEREIIKTIQIQPAPTDANGFVTEPVQNRIALSLSKDEIRIFKYAPLFVGYEFKMADTPTLVTIRSIDYLSIGGFIQLQVTMGEKK